MGAVCKVPHRPDRGGPLCLTHCITWEDTGSLPFFLWVSNRAGCISVNPPCKRKLVGVKHHSHWPHLYYVTNGLYWRPLVCLIVHASTIPHLNITRLELQDSCSGIALVIWKRLGEKIGWGSTFLPVRWQLSMLGHACWRRSPVGTEPHLYYVISVHYQSTCWLLDSCPLTGRRDASSSHPAVWSPPYHKCYVPTLIFVAALAFVM